MGYENGGENRTLIEYSTSWVNEAGALRTMCDMIAKGVCCNTRCIVAM